MHIFFTHDLLSARLILVHKKFMLLLLMLCSTFMATVAAQDVQFSQQFASGAYLNPALAGLSPHIRFSSSYRSQMISSGLHYTTQQVSVTLPFGTGNREVHVGNLGVVAYTDWAGPGSMKTTGGLLSLVYNLPFSEEGKHVLTFGLQGGMIQKDVDFSEGWGSQFIHQRGYDPSVAVSHGQLISSKRFPTIGAGLMWRHDNSESLYNKRLRTHIGLSVMHINTPNEALYEEVPSKLPMLYKASAAYEFRMGEKMRLMPTVLSMYQNQQMQHNGGLFVHYKMNQADPESGMAETELSIGAMYRYQDALIVSAAVHSRRFSFGFSYDTNNTSLGYNTSGRGAFEITLAFQFAKAPKASAPGAPRLQL